MAKILSLNGIITGQPVEAQHVSQSILAFTGLEAYDITVSGSFNVIGTSSLQAVEGTDFSGSFRGDGSRLTGITSSYITASGVDGPYGANSVISSSYALSSSFSDFATNSSASLVADFALTTDSTTSASYSETASFAQTASYLLGTSATASFITASNVYGPYGSNSIISASFASSSFSAISSSHAINSLEAITSSYAIGAATSSFAITASYIKIAETASYVEGFNVGAAGQNSQLQYNNNGTIAGAFCLIYSQSSGYVSIATSSYSSYPLEVAGQIAQTGLNCSVALGRNALQNQSSGINNVAIGEGAMQCADSALLNVAVGFQALRDNDAAERNVAIGHQALRSAISPNNVAVGAQALFNSLCGQDNIGIGNCAAYTNTTGRCNIAIGSRALLLANQGIQNIGIGFQALENVTNGRGNVVMGHEALKTITTGRDNTSIGWNAGFLAANSSTGNVFLGRCAGPSTSQTLSNKLFIHNTQGSPLICGDFSDMQLNINGCLTASGIIYPTADGTANQVLVTDGNGRLSFGAGSVDTASYVSSSNVDGPLGMNSIESASFSLTASFITGSDVYGPYGSGSVVSSSYAISSSYATKNLITASADGSNITFTKGDGTTFDISIGTSGVGASPYSTGSESTSIIPVLGNSINSGSNSNIAGGCLNEISSYADCSSILGGYANINSGSFSSIAGGRSNCIGEQSNCSIIGGGYINKTLGCTSGTTIGGGILNTICGGTNSGHVIAGGTCNCACNTSTGGGHVSILGGCLNTGSGCFSSIVGGHSNYNQSNFGFIGGGCENIIYSGQKNIIVGGQSNTSNGNCSAIVGGNSNCIGTNSCGGVIVGGALNQNQGDESFIGAGCRNCLTGNYSVIVGGTNNTSSAACSFIGGGDTNCVTGTNAAIIAGENNYASGRCSLTSGYNNRNEGNYSLVIGQLNTASSAHNSIIIANSSDVCNNNNSTIIGSSLSCIDVTGEVSSYSSILGGALQRIIGTNGQYNIIGGGCCNQINNVYSSSIVGGTCNCAIHNNTHIIGSDLTTDKACYTFMNNLDVEGTVSGSIFSGSYVGDGSGLTNLNITSNITTFNDNIRYEAYNSTQVIEILSTGTIYSGLDWTRSSTTLTITSPSHGLVNGDYVVIRNMSEDYSYLAVSNVATDTFDVTVADSGGIIGSLGAYIPAARVSSATEAGATIVSPSTGNIQIQSIKVITGVKSTTGFALTMPNSIDNGAGANSSLTNQNPPLLAAYRLDTGGFNASATMILNTASNFNVFNVSNLTNLKNNLIRFTF